MNEPHDPHLRDDVLAAYLDRALDAPVRADADAHLAGCRSCRDELLALSALQRSTSVQRRLLRAGGPLGVIAAGLLIVVLGPWNATSKPGATAERMRESTSVGRVGGNALSAIAPADGETRRPDSLTFTWNTSSRDAGYRLTVADETGLVRWAIDTPDTTITMPDSVQLQRGETYYWYVDALGGDGRTRTSGPRRLRIGP